MKESIRIVGGGYRRGGGQGKKEPENFSLRQVPEAFKSLPRVLSLVWSTSALLTVGLAFLSILQGFTPAITVSITKLVIDSVVRGIRLHSTAPIWLPVGLQLGMVLISN